MMMRIRRMERAKVRILKKERMIRLALSRTLFLADLSRYQSGMK
jgi:hypothetical protein